jgi:hypothetical protein
MEEHVGMIANNPNYTQEALEKLYDSNSSQPRTTQPVNLPAGEDIRLNSVSAPATANQDEVLDRNSDDQ